VLVFIKVAQGKNIAGKAFLEEGVFGAYLFMTLVGWGIERLARFGHTTCSVC